MEKGYSTRNSRPILKLVHPGRFIEKYTKPITADEVMKRHPRHCVAYPDVFTKPWIVVRPESVLLPGNVFYVVSFHTLSHLMRSMPGPTHKAVEQSYGARTVYEGSGQSFADESDFHSLEKGRSLQDRSFEMTISMKTAVERLIRRRTSKEGYVGRDICSYFDDESSDESDRNRQIRKWMINEGSLSAKQFKKGRVNGLNYPVKKSLHRTSIDNSFSSTDHRYHDKSNNATELKSCLKKSRNKLRNLRVRFKLPGDEDKNLQIGF